MIDHIKVPCGRENWSFHTCIRCQMVAIYFILTIIPSSLFLTLFGSENVPQNVFVWLFYHKAKKIYIHQVVIADRLSVIWKASCCVWRSRPTFNFFPRRVLPQSPVVCFTPIVPFCGRDKYQFTLLVFLLIVSLCVFSHLSRVMRQRTRSHLRQESVNEAPRQNGLSFWSFVIIATLLSTPSPIQQS